MRAVIWRFLALCLCSAGLASAVQAQQQPAPGTPPEQPGAQPPPAAQPQPPGEPAPAPGAPVVPEQPVPPPAQPTAPAEPATPPPPPTYPEGKPPAEEPAPRYEQLGKPEPEIEKGDWDPWEHVTPNMHRHDGFMLRLGIGLGGGSISGDDHTLPDVQDVSMSSVGLGMVIGIGGALADNFILNADLFQASMFNPTVKVDGEDFGDANDLDRELGIGEEFELGGIGIGVTYYLMPINIYFAGSIGIAQAVFEDGNGDREGSDLGVAGNIMIGKEWWVGSDWGIGLAGQLLVLRAKDDILGDLTGFAANLMFSATYN